MLIPVFVALILLSVAESRFLNQSLSQLFCFLAYISAFVAGLICLGRTKGPKVVYFAFAIGCGIEALLGIREWEATRAIDPTWRIFANWSNPNALAGILILGSFAALAMIFERNIRLRTAGVFFFALDAFALFLTQSRGGLLAYIIGLCTALLILLTKARRFTKKSDYLPVLAAFALAILLIFGAVHSTQQKGDKAVGTRLTSTSAGGKQSVQFRINLWKSCIILMKMHPSGVGIGAFGNYSSQPGLVSETVLAHDNFLELGTEASIFAPLCLVAIVGAWILACLRGKWEVAERSIPLTFIIGSIIALCVDGVFESNLYFFGIGLAAFLLLGIGLQLAPDGSSPELTPALFRIGAISSTVVAVCGLAWIGTSEWYLARLHYAMNHQDLDGAISASKSASSVNFLCGEAHYLRSFLYQNPTDSIAQIRLACRLDPSIKYLRLLANKLASVGEFSAAQSAFAEALALAPNDLITLRDQLHFEVSSGNIGEAKAVADQMIAVESMPITKVRALYELVPLESIDARMFLMKQANSNVTKADLLFGAVQLEADYARLTVPTLLEFYKKYGTLNWGPENGPKAIKKMQAAIANAQHLLQLDQEIGSTYKQNAIQADIELFQSSLKQLQADSSTQLRM